jgi:hypothetical protein
MTPRDGIFDCSASASVAFPIVLAGGAPALQQYRE